MIEQLISSFLSDLNSVKDIFDLIDMNMEFNDGIEYEDFLNIVEEKENFKEAFEDAIFSTKVIISKKWQFIDFIKKLTENGYYSVALDYLEAHAPLYENDQEVLKLYSLLPKGKI
jgi:DNA-directed RNA polymerase specialized sigma54-like protein